MITDPWQHMLLAIEPTYAKLKDAMETGSTIKPTLKFNEKQWILSIDEKWGTVDDAGNHFNTGRLDECVKWATIELEKWDCQRRSWNMWQFKKKHDAEKFVTLYNLIWAQ